MIDNGRGRTSSIPASAILIMEGLFCASGNNDFFMLKIPHIVMY